MIFCYAIFFSLYKNSPYKNVYKNFIMQKYAFILSFCFLKKLFLKESVKQSKDKKSYRKRNLRKLTKYKDSIRQLYFRALVSTMYRYCRVNVQQGLLLKHLFQRKPQYDGSKNLKVTTSFQKKQHLPLITWDKKHLSTQVASIKYTLENKFFCSCFF